MVDERTERTPAILAFIDKCAHCVDSHYEDSVKLTQDELDALSKRLRKTVSARKQVRTKRTSEKLTRLVRTQRAGGSAQTNKARDHWFETEEMVFGGRIKRHSDSFFRLKAFVVTVDPEELAAATKLARA